MDIDTRYYHPSRRGEVGWGGELVFELSDGSFFNVFTAKLPYKQSFNTVR